VDTVETTQLITSPREIGVRLAQKLLSQFGADLPDQVLMDWQEQVFRGQ
jgi:hypothetical protein